MSPLMMGSRQVKGITAEELASRSESLVAALGTGGEQLDPAQTRDGADVVDKVRARTSLRGGHTVVALAGATGSGKSSLFNTLVGADVATVGARRPTTARPTAAVWGEENATELLDWLSVGQRHHVRAGDQAPADGQPGSLDGLVLLDLPDFDSRVVEHRQEAERILALVDVFVWVTDPQKYADARLHDDYLRALATHDTVTVVVLNQVDRLDRDGTKQIRADLARLAEADGMKGLQVLGTSARTGEGIDDLRLRLAAAVAGQNAARNRLSADIRAVAGRLRSGVADSEPRLSESADGELVDALSRAAGIPMVVAAVERDYRQEAWARTGWPFTRWVRAFRPDPLKRLRLDKGDKQGRGGNAGRHGRRRAQCPRALVAAAARTRRTRCGRPRHPSRGGPRSRGPSRALVRRCRRGRHAPRTRAGRRPRPGRHHHAAARPRPALVDQSWVTRRPCWRSRRWRGCCGSSSSGSSGGCSCPRSRRRGWARCPTRSCSWPAAWPSGCCWRWSPGPAPGSVPGDGRR